jgi:alpha-ketoglutarate-dependent taurine dioxygenase
MTATQLAFRIQALDTKRPDGPALIQPEGSDSPNLAAFIAQEADQLRALQLVHGALLFRGWRVPSPADFEAAAAALQPDLKNDYLGTSPRNQVPGTQFVFTASELPPHYPIMQHCEMSFLPGAPSHLFFYGHKPPAQWGETPIADFAAVWRDMQPAIRDEFAQRGIRYIRNYDGPNSPQGRDQFKLKRWDEMFLTTDRKAIEATCATHDLRVEWLPQDRLRLTNTRPAWQAHPQTGLPVWFNHVQVFHFEAAAIEYQHIYRLRPTFQHFKINTLLQVLTAWKRWFVKPEAQAMHTTFGDGGAIPRHYVRHVQELVWRHLYITPWQAQDVLAIDNQRIAHGRLPYTGPRDILVAWAAPG